MESEEKHWGRTKGFTQSQATKDKIRLGVKAAYEKRKAELKELEAGRVVEKVVE